MSRLPVPVRSMTHVGSSRNLLLPPLSSRQNTETTRLAAVPTAGAVFAKGGKQVATGCLLDEIVAPILVETCAGATSSPPDPVPVTGLVLQNRVDRVCRSSGHGVDGVAELQASGERPVPRLRRRDDNDSRRLAEHRRHRKKKQKGLCGRHVEVDVWQEGPDAQDSVRRECSQSV